MLFQRQEAEVRELQAKIVKREEAVRRLQDKACAKILQKSKDIKATVLEVSQRGRTAGEGGGGRGRVRTSSRVDCQKPVDLAPNLDRQ